MVWYFIGAYIINRTLHGHLEKKIFTRSLRSLVKYFSILKEKFHILAQPCNILHLLMLMLKP